MSLRRAFSPKLVVSCARRLSNKALSSNRMAPQALHRAYIHGDTFFLDEFADRQWDDPNFSGSRFSCDKAQFVDKVHAAHKATGKLVDGYAPFCKHVFIPNEYDDVAVSALPITDANRHLLETAYARRRPEEFAVLTRFFPADKVTAPRAEWLDIILYSREQLVKEHAALHGVSEEEVDGVLPQAPWGIIGIKAQGEGYETPMNPITMMRNALGKAEGGSGVQLVREEYEKATTYWDGHAMIQ